MLDSVRILDMFVCLAALIWLFSLAWDAVKLALKVGFICPFMVDDPIYLDAKIVVAQGLCLSQYPSSTYPLCRKPAFLQMVIGLTCLFNTCLLTKVSQAPDIESDFCMAT